MQNRSEDTCPPKANPVIQTGPRCHFKMDGVRAVLPKGGREAGRGEDRHLNLIVPVGPRFLTMQVYGNIDSVDTGMNDIAVGTLEAFVKTDKDRKVTLRFTIPPEPVVARAELIIEPDIKGTKRPAGWVSTIVVGQVSALDLAAINYTEEQRKAA